MDPLPTPPTRVQLIGAKYSPLIDAMKRDGTVAAMAAVLVAMTQDLADLARTLEKENADLHTQQSRLAWDTQRLDYVLAHKCYIEVGSRTEQMTDRVDIDWEMDKKEIT